MLVLRIPLITAGVFTGLHFFYALLILALGISCLFLPTDYRTAIPLSDTDADDTGAGSEAVRTQEGSKQESVLASDVAVAQQRLSDGSTLIHEIVLQYTTRDNRTLIRRGTRKRKADNTGSDVDADDDTLTLVSQITNPFADSLSGIKDLEYNAGSRGVLRLGIRPDEDGPLRLHVQHS